MFEHYGCGVFEHTAAEMPAGRKPDANPSAEALRHRAAREQRLAEDAEGFRANIAANMRAYRAKKKEERAADAPNPFAAGKVYAVRNRVNDKVYVGATTAPLNVRMRHHQDAANRPTGALYPLMRELGPDQFYIELLDEHPMRNPRRFE